MATAIVVRTATPADAEALSGVVLRALHETNAQDYPPEVIARVAANFTPDRILGLMREREVLVATIADEVVGTASLHNEVVRTVFVLPHLHGRGIGAALMHELECRARSRSLANLTVPSSVTAEGFYRKLGYTAVRDQFHGEERTILMEKPL